MKEKNINSDALKLAGKLALAARLVTKANAKNVSKRIEDMELTLNKYDDLIFSLLNNEKRKSY